MSRREPSGEDLFSGIIPSKLVGMVLENFVGARRRALVVVTLVVVVVLGAVSVIVFGASKHETSSNLIEVVGAENEYANVIAQIGGKDVHVQAIMSNPNTDPHTFEANTNVAREVAGAQLIVQNGVGYDTFMNQLESATSDASRKVR